MIAKLHLLKEFGFRVLLDDFGTGFSFLSQLQELPVDGIKIDQRFVRQLPHCDKSRLIVRALIELADALELSVTAEGVETASQWQCLTAMGCRNLQGYFFSRPAPLEALEDYNAGQIKRVPGGDRRERGSDNRAFSDTGCILE